MCVYIIVTEWWGLIEIGNKNRKSKKSEKDVHNEYISDVWRKFKMEKWNVMTFRAHGSSSERGRS